MPGANPQFRLNGTPQLGKPGNSGLQSFYWIANRNERNLALLRRVYPDATPSSDDVPVTRKTYRMFLPSPVTRLSQATARHHNMLHYPTMSVFTAWRSGPNDRRRTLHPVQIACRRRRVRVLAEILNPSATRHIHRPSSADLASPRDEFNR
ncbi:MAG: hypothetical protein KGL26_01430, partial [Pseudomonadota bacterium]|nr:hypothetical protein [Pseudomonadota bacterium]